jgi:hypothetical protein
MLRAISAVAKLPAFVVCYYDAQQSGDFQFVLHAISFPVFHKYYFFV